MKVLVTGATSLLGGAVAQRLLTRGDDVVTYQRRPSALDTDERLGDIADRGRVADAVEAVDAVIHLAAKVGVTGQWRTYERANIAGTAAVVDACRRAGTGRLVHVSTPSVAHAGRPLVGADAAPADPQRARGHYARSKAQAEIVALAASGPRLAVAVIRPHLVWGPGDSQLVGRIVDRAAAGRLVIVGPGTALVDTTYIDNAAAAIVAALDRADRIAGRPLVVSNGQPRPVAEVLRRITTAAGVEPPRLRVPAVAARTAGSMVERVWARLDRTDDPPMTRFVAEQFATAHWFDQRETQELLQWRPEVGLDEGFRRLADWYRAGETSSPNDANGESET